MILGFFVYIGGNSQAVGVGVMLAGVVFELLGFLLAYLEYKVSVKVRRTAPRDHSGGVKGDASHV